MNTHAQTSPVAAWPAPPQAPVLLFGGTFDPPHLAHTRLARAARDAVFPGDGWLVYVPAARNPHKADGPVATDAQRVEMLRLATEHAERVAVWTDEIDRAAAAENTDDYAAQPSFWVDTLHRARRVAPDTPLRFLIGADQAIAFDRWHAHSEILDLAEPAVLLRDPCPTREAFRTMLLTSGLDPAEWMPRIVPAEVDPAASTDVRTELARGDRPEGLLDAGVLDYITTHGLYAG